MKKSEVSVGKVYVVKVSGRIVPVRLVRESEYGGWIGRNEKTGRNVRIRTAAKLRREIIVPKTKPSLSYFGEEADPLRPNVPPTFPEGYTDTLCITLCNDEPDGFDKVIVKHPRTDKATLDDFIVQEGFGAGLTVRDYIEQYQPTMRILSYQTVSMRSVS